MNFDDALRIAREIRKPLSEAGLHEGDLLKINEAHCILAEAYLKVDTKVWVVSSFYFNGEYTEQEPHSVFSTEEKAIEFCEGRNNNPKNCWEPTYNYEEFLINQEGD